MILKRSILVLLLLLTSLCENALFSQDEAPIIIVHGKVGDNYGKKLSGVSIQVMQNGSAFNSVTSASNGKYPQFELPWGFEYQITFSVNGYVTKSVALDTKKGYFQDDVQPVTDMDVSMTLFEQEQNVDYSIVTSKPVGKAHIDPSTGGLDWDGGFTQTRKKEIDKFLESLANRANEDEAKYQQLVKDGDKAVSTSNFEQGIAKYEEALKLKNESTLKVKIDDAKKKIEEREKAKVAQEAFAKKIKEGDDLLTANKVDEAIKKYEEAKTLKPGDPVPDTKIKAAKDKLKEQEATAKDKEYKDKLAEANGAFEKKEYDLAKPLYEEAQKIKPSETFPKERIAEIAAIKKQLENLEKSYSDAVANGEKSITAKKYDEALKLFEEAGRLKPQETLPKNKIEEVKKLMAENKAAAELDLKYKSLLAEADNEFKAEKWAEAKKKYQDALAVKDEAYPKDQIKLADDKIKALADKAAADKEKDEKYSAAIAKADEKMKNSAWDEAITAYKEALSIKQEKYPEDQIKNAEAKKKELEAAATAKETNYNALLKKGDEALGKSDFTAAISAYEEAGKLFPDKPEYKSKIQEAKDKQADKTAKEGELKAKETEYVGLVASGDQKLSAKDFTGAKADFEKAKALFPERDLSKKIGAVDAGMAELKAGQEKDTQYKTALGQADAARDAKQWEKAKELYKEANKIKPSEKYPQEQIDAINKAMADETQAERDEQYKKVLEVAGQKLQEGNMKKALELYNRAKEMNPADPFPTTKITEIEKELARINDIEQRYKSTLAKADQQFSTKSWEAAKTLYNEALAIKKDETYPKDQIAIIDKKIAEKQAAVVAESEKEKKYEKLIEKGDDELKKEEFVEAKETFTEASEIRPDATYPKNKIVQIDEKVTEIQKAKEEDTKYADLITKANGFRDNKKWNEAKDTYKEAFTLRPKDQYPQEQINWINEQMKAEQEAEFRLQIQKIIDKADELFAAKSYKESKELYERAKGLDKNNTYAAKRIKEIELLLADSKENKIAENPNDSPKDKEYKKIIGQAEDAKAKEQWSNAKDLFKKAFDVKPQETYPQEQIDWINKKMKEISQQEAQEQYKKILQVANSKYATEEYEKAIELYERAHNMNPDDPFPPAQIAKLKGKMLESKEDPDAAYREMIALADQGFNEKKYKLALSKYESAKGMKPTESYPQERIDEINRILNELTAVKPVVKEEPKTEKIVKDFMTNPYGEEITGKYKEDDIISMFRKVKLDEEDYKAQIVEAKKEDLADDLDAVAKEGADRVSGNHEGFEALETKRTDESRENDAARLDFLPSMERYKDSTSDEKVRLADKNVEYSLSLQDDFERRKTVRASAMDSLDDPRKKMVEKIEAYTEAKSENESQLIKKSSESTFKTHDDHERMDAELEAFHKGKDDPRLEKVVPEMDSYKDGVATSIQLIAQNEDRIASQNYIELEQLKTNGSEDAVEAGKIRSNLNSDMTRYVLEREKAEVDASARNTERAYATFEEHEAIDARLEEFSKEADLPRQNVLSDVDHYKDKVSTIQDLRGSDEIGRSLQLYEINELMETERSLEFSDNSDRTERNAEHVESYSDKLEQARNEKIESSKDALEERRNERDDLKVQSPTMFSEENRQELADRFPPGVTEKMYQRKNSRGDVIEVTIIRYVVVGNKGDEYKKVISKWGENYFKNGGVISEYIWDTETN